MVIIKERQTDLTWMLLYYCIVVAGRGNLGYGKSGTYTVQQARNPKDGLIGIQLKRNSAILPRSTDTTSPPFLVRKITIGDIHFYISISFSISSSLLNVFSSG